jgi:hypothetical protein
MSKWHEGRRRKEAQRELNRFSIQKRYQLTDGKLDYSKPLYRFRPKGFDTTLFDVVKPPHTSVADFEAVMDAVQTLTWTTPR